MDHKFFLNGIKNILQNPAKLWEPADSENITISHLRDSFLFPLIIFVSVSAFAGSLLFVNSELSVVYSIFTGIKCFGLMYLTIYGSAYIFSEITYPLDLGKNFLVSFRIIVFSVSPFLLCQIVSRLFESLLFVNIIGLYGLYIFWTGIEKMLNPPQYKKIPLLIATTVSLVGIYIITDLLLSMLTDRLYFAFFA